MTKLTVHRQPPPAGDIAIAQVSAKKDILSSKNKIVNDHKNFINLSRYSFLFSPNAINNF
jgi:hypothetical protein